MTSVVLDVERLRNIHCGLGQYCLHLYHALLDATQSGPDISIVPLLRFQHREHLAGRSARVLQASTWRGTPTAHLIRPWVSAVGRGESFGLWHATHQDTRFLPLDRTTPLVLTIHDLNILREKSPGTIRRRLRRMQTYVDRATAITTASEFAAGEIRAHLRVGDKPIAVIPHGVCLDRVDQTGCRPEFLPEAPFLFTIGDVTPKKNFHVLVDLIARLPDFQLVIAGNKATEYGAQIERTIKSRGLDSNVCLLGKVSDAERTWLYRNCAAFLFPSLSEGFGLPLIEAMSCGRPVFASDRTSLPEVGASWAFYWSRFEPDEMARVFRAGMKQVGDDPDFSQKLRRHAAEFTWQRAASAYLNVYREVLERRRPSYAA